jgi:hypothetical protein
VTFTKRPERNTLAENKRAPHEPVVCGSCGALYKNRRWIRKEQIQEMGLLGDRSSAAIGTCRACKLTRSDAARGFLYLRGPHLKVHLEEIEHFLKLEEQRAMEDNPLGRIMRWEQKSPEELIALTTTEHLAQRLGKALERSFGGRVHYDFSHENKQARVYWER